MGVSADKIAAHNIPDAIANSQSRPDCIQTIPQRHLKVTHLVEQCRVQDHKGWVKIPVVHTLIYIRPLSTVLDFWASAVSGMNVHDNSVSNCARVRTHATAPIVVYEYRISHDPTVQKDTAQICICREVERNLVQL